MHIAFRISGFRLSCSLLFALTACSAAERPQLQTVQSAGAETRAAPVLSVRRSAAVEPLSGAFGAYLAGRAAFAASDTTEAAKQFSRALSADPANPLLREQTFLAALMDGQPGALGLARQLPNLAGAQLLLITNDARNNRWDRVEQRVRGLPENSLPLLRPLLLAWAQFGRGQVDAALATLRPLSEGASGTAFHALHAGLIADLADRPNEALRNYQRAEAADAQPNLRMALILASFYMRNGQPQNARRSIDSLAAMSDDFALMAQQVDSSLNVRPVPSASAGLAEAYMTLGSVLRQQRNSDEALMMLRLALHLRPDFTAARLILADLLSSEQQYEQADTLLSMVVDNDMLLPVVRMRRAQILDAMGKKAEAERALRAIVEDYPDRTEPLVRLGDLLRVQSRYIEAETVYSAAIRKIGTPEPRHWPLFYVRGIVRERSGQWDKGSVTGLWEDGGEADLQQARRLNPNQPYVLNFLGYTWADRGVNLEQARRVIERAIELRPNDGHIIDSLGWVQFRMGDIRGGLQTLERAIELEPRDVTVNDHLGDLYWASGRRREAEFQWRRALLLNPEPIDAARIERKLREGLPASQMPPPPPPPEAPR